MTLRWQRLLKILIPAVTVMLLPVVLRLLLFRFDYATCVRRYADGRAENDYDEGCYDDTKPAPIAVFKSKRSERQQNE